MHIIEFIEKDLLTTKGYIKPKRDNYWASHEKERDTILRVSGLDNTRDGIIFLLRGYRFCDRCKINKTKVWPANLDARWYCSFECGILGRPPRTHSEDEKRRRREASVQKFGSACPANYKREDVMLRKYGVSNPSQVEEFKLKARESRKRTTASPEYKLQRIHKHLGKLGIDATEYPEEIVREVRVTNMPKEYFLAFLNRFEGHSLNSPVFGTRTLPNRYLDFHRVGRGEEFREMISQTHRDLMNMLTEHGIEYIINDRKTIAPFELDIFIPTKRIGVEINGSYWHSEEMLGADYHFSKVNACNRNDISLISVFDWDDVDVKFEIILGRHDFKQDRIIKHDRANAPFLIRNHIA